MISYIKHAHKMFKEIILNKCENWRFENFEVFSLKHLRFWKIVKNCLNKRVLIFTLMSLWKGERKGEYDLIEKLFEWQKLFDIFKC